jgi:predicted DCC family thiol-disulfide oxidoreductase YuxK
MRRNIKKMIVYYDENCAVCRRCKSWMQSQAHYVELEFVAASSERAQLSHLNLPSMKDELVLVSDQGEVWVGAQAFIVALWTLKEWRGWSYRLRGDMLRPVAERFFKHVSKRRHWLGTFIFEQDKCTSVTCTKHESPYR